MVQKDIYTPMFIPALFTKAETWTQLKCPFTEEQIQKAWWAYTVESDPAVKKSAVMPFAATWMGLEITRLSEVSQTETEKGFIVLLICGVLKN